MTLRIEQSASYAGKDRWHWHAKIAGEAAELARLQKVTWYLHPSFSPSVVSSTDASSGFALHSSGWGTFELRALARDQDGGETELRHALELFYPDEDDPALDRRARTQASRPRSSAPTKDRAHEGKKVFLSFGSEDREQARAVRSSLEQLGATVVDQSGVTPGAPMQHALQALLAACDQVVAVLSSPVPSQWVAEEMALAQRLGKPLLLFKSRGMPQLKGLLDAPSSIQEVTLGDGQSTQTALAHFLET